MADNVAISPGVGDTVGADDISGVKYQRIKIITGADGTNDGDVTTSNPFPVRAVPDRPSQGAGRTYKTAQLSNQTADALLYTVTAGKTLYITALDVFVFNTSTTQVGVLEIKDGTTSAGATRYPLLMSAAGVGAVTAASAVSHAAIILAEPLQMSTGIFCDVISGTLTYSAFLTGYEA